MDTNQIRILLAKYFEGITTLEEESILLEYFNNGNELPEELVGFKKQFELIFNVRKIAFDESVLNNKILRSIDSFENSKANNVKKIRNINWLAAASIAILIGLAGVIFYNIKSDKPKDTYSDPKLAYVETKNALLYISGQINKGIDPLSDISKINAGTDHLKDLEKMDKSLEMLHLVSFINKPSYIK